MLIILHHIISQLMYTQNTVISFFIQYIYVYEMLHANSLQEVMNGQTNIRTMMKNTVLLHILIELPRQHSNINGRVLTN